MSKPPSGARASPKMSERHHKLLYEAFEDAQTRMIFLHNTEEHVEWLLAHDREECAIAFLAREEDDLQKRIAELPRKKLRKDLRLIVPGSLAVLAGAAKIVSILLGS